MAVFVNYPQDKKRISKILPLVALFASLPLLILAISQVTSYLSKAAAVKANIVIDTGESTGSLTGNWLNFAQGGEEPPPMLKSTVENMKNIKPKYIRLDHIYDYYDVVKSDGTFDFSHLDTTVDDITAMGARPMLALTYMPRSFTDSNSVIDAPRNWRLWQNLVRATIEHYSGKREKNIGNVYYEVWNEPDLPQFGSFKLYGTKNYNTLYHYAANGAAEALDTNQFYFGGPAVGSYYPAWVTDFVNYVRDNNLRLDFYSWHRYHTDPSKFREDAINIRKILNKYPRFAGLPLALTEWGIDSENTQNSNTNRAAAHAISTIIKVHDVINLPFAFEVKDGPPPNGGKWGLMTHEKDSSPLSLKPRFKAFAASSIISGPNLKTEGNGTHVQAISSRGMDGTIYVLITNYDVRDSNFENVPVSVTGVDPGLFKVTDRNITTGTEGSEEITSTDGTLKKEIAMLPNTTHLLEIKKSGNVVELINGPSATLGDRAFILSGNRDLILSPFAFEIMPQTEFRFDLRSLLTDLQPEDTAILKFDLANPFGERSVLSLQKTSSRNLDFLLLTLSNNNDTRLAAPIPGWTGGNWHNIKLSFIENNVRLSVNGVETKIDNFSIGNDSRITGVTFYPNYLAIDNLEFEKAGIILFNRNFD